MGAAEALAEVRVWAAVVYLELGDDTQAVETLRTALVYAREVGHEQLSLRAKTLCDDAHENLAAIQPKTPEDLLLALSVAIYDGLDTTSALQQVADTLLDMVTADRAAVLLVDGDDVQFAARALRQPSDAHTVSNTLIRRCISLRKEVLVADLNERGDLRHANSLLDTSLKCVMCLPLQQGPQLIGVLYADSRHISESAMVALLPYVRSLAAHATTAICHQRKHEQTRLQIAELERLSKVKDEFLAT
jgi:transcriptional regulator with GAF, ATPase, and Fis domain